MIQYFILAGFAFSVLLWIFGAYRAIKKNKPFVLLVSISLMWVFILLGKLFA